MAPPTLSQRQAIPSIWSYSASPAFKIASNTPGDFKLTLRQRDKEIASKNVSVGTGAGRGSDMPASSCLPKLLVN